MYCLSINLELYIPGSGAGSTNGFNSFNCSRRIEDATVSYSSANTYYWNFAPPSPPTLHSYYPSPPSYSSYPTLPPTHHSAHPIHLSLVLLIQHLLSLPLSYNSSNTFYSFLPSISHQRPTIHPSFQPD